MGKSVLVAMSGGVDSSVSAYLLKQQGYKVEGMTLNLYHQTQQPQHIEDAKKAAHILNIPLHIVNYEDLFSKKIIDYFKHAYLEGKTPNPCIFCNRYIKFAALEQLANELNLTYIATGHYATIVQHHNETFLSTGDDEKKSQEYFLSLIPKSILKKIIFPLSHYKKSNVREIAKKAGMDLFSVKPDSQEICFLSNTNYVDFIKKNTDPEMLPQKGEIQDQNGNFLGQHSGFYQFTIGQRKGIGIGIGKPQYVFDIHPNTNIVKIGDRTLIEKKQIVIKIINLFQILDQNLLYFSKIRYNASKQQVEISSINKDLVTLTATETFFAPSKGQLTVLYLNDIVIGAGEII